jgi:hypothetical protein
MERSPVEPVNRYTRVAQIRPVGSGSAVQNAATVEAFKGLFDDVSRTRPRPEEIERFIGRFVESGSSSSDAVMKRAMLHIADRAAFAREVLQFDPEPLQEFALRSWSRRLILNCNRQWGKSTVAAIRAVHRAWFWPGSLILIVSRTHAQAGELLQKIRAFFADVGDDGEERRCSSRSG